jgi:hypothetical protein
LLTFIENLGFYTHFLIFGTKNCSKNKYSKISWKLGSDPDPHKLKKVGYGSAGLHTDLSAKMVLLRRDSISMLLAARYNGPYAMSWSNHCKFLHYRSAAGKSQLEKVVIICIEEQL